MAGKDFSISELIGASSAGSSAPAPSHLKSRPAQSSGSKDRPISTTIGGKARPRSSSIIPKKAGRGQWDDEEERQQGQQQAEQQDRNVLDEIITGGPAQEPSALQQAVGNVTGGSPFTTKTGINLGPGIDFSGVNPVRGAAEDAYNQAEAEYNKTQDALRTAIQNAPGDIDYETDPTINAARAAAKKAEDDLRIARDAYEQAGGMGHSYSMEDRASDIVKGAAGSTAASDVDAVRAVWEKGENQREMRRAEEEATLAELDASVQQAQIRLDDLMRTTGGDTSNPAVQQAMERLRQEQDFRNRYVNATNGAFNIDRLNAVTGKAQAIADQLAGASAQDIERAKEGLNGFERFLVDAGVSGTQMAMDAAVSAMTGGLISPEAAMAMRSFGGGTMQARQGGGDIDQQLMYGGATAVLEVLTEKMFDGLAGIYGKGAADEVVEEVIGKMAKTDAGRTALRTLFGAGGEAAEELVSGVANPALQSIYNGQSIGQNYSETDAKDILYDALVGGLIGFVGGAGSITTGQNAAKNAELRANDARAQQAQAPQTTGIPALDVIQNGEVQQTAPEAQTPAPEVETPAAEPAAPATEAERAVTDALNGTVSNSVANRILETPELFDTLKQMHPEVDFNGMSKSEARVAIKGISEAQQTQVAETTAEEAAPETPTAPEAEEPVRNPVMDVIENGEVREEAPAPAVEQPAPDPAPVTEQAVETEQPASQAPLTPTAQTTEESTNGTGNERERGGSANIRTNENAEADLRQTFENNPATYRQMTNAEVQAKADAIIAKGYDAARSEVEQAIGQAKAGKKLAPEHLVAAFEVANEMTRRGETDAANRLMADVFAEQTAAGQLGQLGRLLRQNSPAVKSMTIQNIVDKMNNALTKGQKAKNQGRGIGDAEGRISVDQALVDQFANAQTDAEADAAMDAIMDSIADQIPATIAEKFTALRYLNMLGNIKTQGRNIIGNAAMMVVSDVKRAMQALNEMAAYAATGGKYERNTALFTSRDLRKQAAADFDANVDTIKGESKYSDASRKALQGVQDRRTIFGSGKSSQWASNLLSSILGREVDVKQNIVEDARLLTNWAMDAGDVIFMKHTYKQAFAGWMKAHGIENVSDATAEQLARAREFATKEAREATFHDDNKVSDFVSSIGRGDKTPAAVNALMEGIMPFRKTPANVAVRAIEYSPLGVAKTIADWSQMKSGKKTGADVINDLSKTATGTALAVAGYFLAAAGKARASGDDEDKDLNYFQQMRGEADYSVKIGDKYVSLSQFAPSAIPFFMGVKLQEMLENTDELLSLDNVGDLLGIVSDPMLEMSMLSGINDTLNNIASLNGDTDALPSLLTNAAVGYLTQGLSNTFIGQLEQASEENRQATYGDTRSEDATAFDQVLGSKGQKTLAKFSAKIPGWDYNTQDYVDAWGRTQSNGGLGERLINSLLNPTYLTDDRSTRVDDELERLHTENSGVEDFPEVLPQKRGRNDTIGDGIVMTPDEYLQYSKDAGQMKLDLVSDFMDSEEYQNLDDRTRAEVISNLYQFADDRALARVREHYGVERQSEYDKLMNGTYDADGTEKRPPLEEGNIGEFITFDTAAKGAANNGDYDALESVFGGFGDLDANTQAVLAAKGGDVGKYARLVMGKGEEGDDKYVPPLDTGNVGEYAQFHDGANNALQTGDFDELGNLFNNFGNLDANTQAVLAAKGGDVGKYAKLVLGTDKPGESYDIPSLNPENVGEYATFENGLKDATEGGDYSAVDDLLANYRSLDANTRAVLSEKNPSNMNGVMRFINAGSGSEAYYKVKDAVGDAQWELDASSSAGSHVRMEGLAKADIPTSEKDLLVRNGALDLSKTAKSVYEILRGENMSPGDISKWFTNADWYASGSDKTAEANGQLNAYEVAVAISKIPNMTDWERQALYNQFKAVLQKPNDAYDTWKNRSYQTTLRSSTNRGRTVGKGGAFGPISSSAAGKFNTGSSSTSTSNSQAGKVNRK